jgi:hypothetical protein
VGPAGKKVAVAVDLTLKNPGTLLGTSAHAYFLATPEIGENGTVLGISNLKAFDEVSQTQNQRPEGRVLTDAPFLEAISSATKLDIRPELAALSEEVKRVRGLELTHELRLTFAPVSQNVVGLAIDRTGIGLDTAFNGSLMLESGGTALASDSTARKPSRQ